MKYWDIVRIKEWFYESMLGKVVRDWQKFQYEPPEDEKEYWVRLAAWSDIFIEYFPTKQLKLINQNETESNL